MPPDTVYTAYHDPAHPILVINVHFDFLDESGLPVRPATKPEAKSVLEGMAKVYGDLADFTEANLETAARSYAKENGMKAGQIFHPVRVAVSGRTHGPTLFKMLEYMGKDTVVARLKAALALCK